MFKYRNVMIASFTLFFFSTLVHLIYSCLTLPEEEMIYSLVFGGVLFAVPLIFTAIGKLKRAQPYVISTFFAVSCFVLSVINGTAFYLPALCAAAVVLCGFFLSSKLCLWYLLFTDIMLIANAAFFMPDETEHLISVYLIVCICYNISGLGMTLFVQAVKNSITFLHRKSKKLYISNRKNNEFWAASAERMKLTTERLSKTCGGLLARTDIPAPVRERLFKIQSETGRLSISLSDAEDYALMESGSMTLNNEPYSFHSLVSDTANFCFAACTKPDLDIIIDCQPDIPAVLVGDSRRITQVVLSLFANSVKFTDSGSITVSFRARKTARGVNLHIEVKDTGSGVTAGAARKLFTVYAEPDKDKPAVHLGLGVSKKLVSLMGGFIFVRNVKTGGSRFVVTIPQEAASTQPFASVPDRDRISVLLYLKSGVAASAACTQLEKLSVRCTACRSRADFILKKDDPEITHIFFDYGFYPFDKPIFDIMARVKTVVSVCGEGEAEIPLPKNIKRVIKPLNITAFTHIFNRGQTGTDGFVQDFTAPDVKALTVVSRSLTGSAQPLKALEKYEIAPVYTDEERVIEELKKESYDIIFLCGCSEKTAAHIMCCDDGMFMNIPVISVGDLIGGCSDHLNGNYSPYELNEILIKWLPEELMRPAANGGGLELYEELDPRRGLASAGGSRSAYKEMLEIFEDRAKESLETLSTTIENKNFELCTIHLHSLQSTAASIGAVSAAEIARQLKSAAEKKEYTLLKELNVVLSSKLNRLLTDIAHYYQDNGIADIDGAQLGIYAEKISEALSEENPETAEEIAEELLENHTGYRSRIIVKAVLNKIRLKDYEKALADLEKLKEGGKNND